MEVFALKKKCGFIGHFVFFMILALTVVAVAHARGVHLTRVDAKLYMVDAEMLRLIPVKIKIPEGDTQRMAQRLLDELIEGRDENPKIRRLIPKIRGCLTARIEDYNVTVNISGEVLKKHPEGRDLELLTIYQIVNTLTELNGIKTVRFTIDGKVQRNFMGYIDMRETFVPDYFI